jgi:hypothetical protein
MAFETLNLILSTVLSITFIPCCKIVLMFYNVLLLPDVAKKDKTMFRLSEITTNIHQC